MQITYASKAIQRLCEEDKHQRKQLGEAPDLRGAAEEGGVGVARACVRV